MNSRKKNSNVTHNTNTAKIVDTTCTTNAEYTSENLVNEI